MFLICFSSQEHLASKDLQILYHIKIPTPNPQSTHTTSSLSLTHTHTHTHKLTFIFFCCRMCPSIISPHEGNSSIKSFTIFVISLSSISVYTCFFRLYSCIRLYIVFSDTERRLAIFEKEKPSSMKFRKISFGMEIFDAPQPDILKKSMRVSIESYLISI